ncbi:hypothetical protein [Inediibacterium massiliense]|uniref:hypothetical protein n=1 Tax=Inediibacterium massiliense TaxID=1658111 RepID=UPI0018FE19BE|nr:hypothetical protein [Inediibacterium massiliense]
MPQQKIKVIVNIPDKSVLEKRMARALAKVVIGRVNKLDIDERKIVYDEILRRLKNT